MNFNKFKQAVAHQFDRICSQNSEVFRADVSGEELWETYLRSFPEGSNQIFRERTKHDCQACKRFIKSVGNVVFVDKTNLKIESIWDCVVPNEPEYQSVADTMAEFVKSHPVGDVFLSSEKTAGLDKSFEQVADGVLTWNHFFVNIPVSFQSASIGTTLSETRTDFQLLSRGLREITVDAIETVVDLVSQGSLYRGDEFIKNIKSFMLIKKMYNGTPNEHRHNFVKCWSSVKMTPRSVSRIRSSSIGMLLIGLSDGVSLEQAVSSFEKIVAPENYKRPSSLVTKAMVESAKKTVEELGLTSALERRVATIDDINIENLLFVDRKRPEHGDVFDSLSTHMKSDVINLKRIEEIGIDKFLTDVVPNASAISIMPEWRHAGNFVSLIAPEDPTATKMFTWNNRFSWSYAGAVADSIAERVKKAGGNIEADFRCSLSWMNTDDLDLELVEPSGNKINFANMTSMSGGRLDVDMNCDPRRVSTDPVENIVYKNRSTMREGPYTIRVHQYESRNFSNLGFEVEVSFLGETFRFSSKNLMRTDDKIVVAKFRYSHKNGVQIIKSMDITPITKKIWGVNTQSFHKVTAIMLSPNFWEAPGIGNKHFFFMLEGCVGEGERRGFYNEFLRGDLREHRKVFEVLGGKIAVSDNESQLSGVGFSSTKRNSILCKVVGKFTRILRVTF